MFRYAFISFNFLLFFYIQFGVFDSNDCEVPIDVSTIRMLYVFVDIQIDLAHFVATIKHNFAPGYEYSFLMFDESINYV